MSFLIQAIGAYSSKIFETHFYRKESTLCKTILLFALLLGSSSCACANGDVSTKEIELFQPVTSSKIEGVDFARLCISKYPEILLLARKDVRKTEEGSASLQAAYSEQLFGEKFIEFDRTIMTLRCLALILDGGSSAYEAFTAAQPKEVKLSKESFDQLHLQSIYLTRPTQQYLELEMIQAMETALVLGDIGKSEQARALFKPYGASAPDHDDFHEEVMQILQKHPELSPSFNRLSVAGKKLITKSANLAHYGHITHIEGGPSMYAKLKERLPNVSSDCLAFDFFVHTCDVAGALGHVNNHSSLVYIESTHLAMQKVFESCKMLTSSSKTEADAYDAYLAIRAKWLGLDANDRMDRALVRMGAMLRLFSKEEGAVLKDAISKLPTDIQTQIIEQLDIRKGEELERTPTYMPAVLINLANNLDLGTSKEERLSQAVILGLPFIAKVLKTHKEQLVTSGGCSAIPLNFNKAASIAKTKPAALNGEFMIDSDGNVSVTPYTIPNK